MCFKIFCEKARLGWKRCAEFLKTPLQQARYVYVLFTCIIEFSIACPEYGMHVHCTYSTNMHWTQCISWNSSSYRLTVCIVLAVDETSSMSFHNLAKKHALCRHPNTDWFWSFATCTSNFFYHPVGSCVPSNDCTHGEELTSKYKATTSFYSYL